MIVHADNILRVNGLYFRHAPLSRQFVEEHSLVRGEGEREREWGRIYFIVMSGSSHEKKQPSNELMPMLRARNCFMHST